MFNENGDAQLRKVLFHKKRIGIKRLHSNKGASVVFALIGFMFAAMISFVVINAAYSAASRVKKQKYDEQSFLLAQSMSGIITEALTGDNGTVTLPNGTVVKSPSGADLKRDALTLSYQYIEQKETSAVDGSTNTFLFYNNAEDEAAFTKSVTTGTSKKTFTTLKGKTLTGATLAVQTMIVEMAKKVDQGVFAEGSNVIRETLTTSNDIEGTGESLVVTTEFKMDKSYSISAVTTATVSKGGSEKSRYVVRMDASAAVRTDKIICAGTKAGDTITAAFTDTVADGEQELVKVSCYSVTWPQDQMRYVYVE